ncbi:DUF1425 domain-containing protein [Opitutaceae bacterium TAV4]|uniref:YcfL family protein n=1 Tax=Geminisphaera colitermitum TaxID=1148786 RepID=UPI000158D3EC|nr:YcfL family protein [Geminisphaera colitermitum]RRJ95151.1 DUF1425 domain-containing protein [Opitutaceae bacterium TAV4]RRJ99409.1 DUF1425 domain-containing protein [Opitutaceae bacterium TAV3]
MKKLIPLLASSTVAFVAAFFAPGCSNSVNTVQRADPQARPDTVTDQRIITDSSLARALAIVSVNQATVSGDLLQVQVTLENRKNDPRTFRYKFDWIAANGMQLDSTGGWRVIHLRGRETSAISAVATSPRAVDFRVKLEATD